MLCILNFL